MKYRRGNFRQSSNNLEDDDFFGDRGGESPVGNGTAPASTTQPTIPKKNAASRWKTAGTTAIIANKFKAGGEKKKPKLDVDDPRSEEFKELNKKKRSKCQKFGRACIILTNVIFIIFAAAILLGGVLLFAGVNIYGKPLTSEGTLGFLTQLAPMANITNSTATPEQEAVMKADMSVLTSEVSYGLLAVGGVMLLMSIFGMILFCCGDKCLLIVYGVVMSIIIVTQLAGVIIFGTGVVNDAIKVKLNNTLQTSYFGEKYYSSKTSVTWNFFMVQFQCCGVDSYFDFKNSSSWGRVNQFDILHNNSVVQYYDITETPFACCKLNGTIPDVTDYMGGRSFNTPACAKTPLNETYSNYNKGCWTAVSDVVKQYMTVILAVSATVLVLQIVLLVVTLYLFIKKMRQDEEEEQEDMEPVKLSENI